MDRGSAFSVWVLLAGVGCGAAEPPGDDPTPTHEARPEAPVPDFAVTGATLGLSEDLQRVVISVHDLDGGCQLPDALTSAPPGAGNQVVATVATAGAPCPSGVYPMGSDCVATAPAGATGAFTECAEYRRWNGGVRLQSTIAMTGTVTLQQTWIDTTTADCAVDVNLAFASGDGLSYAFTVRVDQMARGAPYCSDG